MWNYQMSMHRVFVEVLLSGSAVACAAITGEFQSEYMKKVSE